MNSNESAGSEPKRPSGAPVSVSGAGAVELNAPRGLSVRHRAGDIRPDAGMGRADELAESAGPARFLPRGTTMAVREARSAGSGVRPPGLFARTDVSLPNDAGVLRGARGPRVALRAAAQSVRR